MALGILVIVLIAPVLAMGGGGAAVSAPIVSDCPSEGYRWVEEEYFVTEEYFDDEDDADDDDEL